MQTRKHSLLHISAEFILSGKEKLRTFALKFHLAIVQFPWCISINLYKFMQLLLFIYLTRATSPAHQLCGLLFVLSRTRLVSPCLPPRSLFALCSVHCPCKIFGSLLLSLLSFGWAGAGGGGLAQFFIDLTGPPRVPLRTVRSFVALNLKSHCWRHMFDVYKFNLIY